MELEGMATYFAMISYGLLPCVLIALAVYDYRHYILPDLLNIALGLLFLSFHIATGWVLVSPLSALAGAVAGGGLLLGIRAAANRYYDEDALGLGDVKLMAAAGLGLGMPDVLLALSLGAGLGLVHGAAMGLGQKRKGQKVDFRKISVPAGLGLCAGIAIVAALRFGTGWMP